MLKTALQQLTPAHKAELRSLGISDQLRSDWLHDRKMPSQAQAAILEAMCNLPEHSLRDWITMEKATPLQRDWLLRAAGKLGKHTATLGVLVMLCFGLAGNAQLAWPRGLRTGR